VTFSERHGNTNFFGWREGCPYQKGKVQTHPIRTRTVLALENAPLVTVVVIPTPRFADGDVYVHTNVTFECLEDNRTLENVHPGLSVDYAHCFFTVRGTA
jgi:hypothetical protein